MNPIVIFRVDGNQTIGIGHVKRCIVLACELKYQNINSVFLSSELTDNLKSELDTYALVYKMIDDNIPEIIQIHSTFQQYQNYQWKLVIDSDRKEYYSKEFQCSIRDLGIRLSIITFYSEPEYFADVILNQNIMALDQTYSVQPFTKKLLGPQYLIINQLFRRYLKKNETRPFLKKKNHVLIYFGGADQNDRTSWTVELLQKLQNKPDHIHVVVSSTYPYLTSLKDLVKTSSIELTLYVDTDQMPYIMSQSKYSFTSGGLTMWELGIMNVLNFVIGLSNREVSSGAFCSKKGYCYYLGEKRFINDTSLIENIDHILLKEKENAAMVKSLNTLLNPDGIQEVCEAIIGLS